MGQKVNPISIRLGINKKSISCWYANKKNYAKTLYSDYQIRNLLEKRLPSSSSISKIKIERTGSNIKLTLCTAKPGIVIGRKGEDIEKIRKEFIKKLKLNVHINIEEIRKPKIDALLVSQNIAQQLEKRIMFRRAMKRAVSNAMRQGALGIKARISGRLGGIEIARTEWYREGRVPMHTFRADIDYGFYEAMTTYGVIGVQVWIFKGEILNKNKKN